ncbi:MAG: glycosyltransferase [Saprospiraceae bacterium]|nr:glycosyltransferase [Saprospiraceae bacterium]
MKTHPLSISLVIPCYNESKRLPLLIKGLEAFHSDWEHHFEILVVDDGSQDGTAPLVKQLLENKFPNRLFKVIALPQNQGKGGALQAGVEQARGNYILTLDADMAAQPTQLIAWLKQLNGTFPENTILIASRNHALSKIEAKTHRKITGSLFNQLVQFLTPIRQSDTQCGFKLYPRFIGQLLFRELQLKGWAHDIELLYKAYYLDIPVKAMPVEWTHVNDEKIDVLRDGIKMAWQTIKISWQFQFHPKKRKELNTLKIAYQKELEQP